MYNFAPIGITVYNRHNHLYDLLTSLSQDPFAVETPVYVISDAPANDKDFEDVVLVRKLKYEFSNSFKELNFIENRINIGFNRSYQKLITEVFKKYDRIIFFEDDNLTSPHFLRYMNEMFLKYETNNEIRFICGYNYPIELPTDYHYDIYFAQKVSAWGYGFWKNKYLNVHALNKKDMLGDLDTLKILKNNSPKTYYTLMNDLLGEKILNDARIEYLLTKNNWASIFPVKPLVKNTGHDGSGLNCGEDSYYQNQMKDDSFIPNNTPNAFIVNDNIQAILREYSDLSLLEKLKCELKILVNLARNKSISKL